MTENFEELEKLLKESLDEMQTKLDELESAIAEIDLKINESSEQLKSLKNDI